MKNPTALALAIVEVLRSTVHVDNQVDVGAQMDIWTVDEVSLHDAADKIVQLLQPQEEAARRALAEVFMEYQSPTDEYPVTPDTARMMADLCLDALERTRNDAARPDSTKADA